jgi:lipoprotein-anchoring transpeptidase ErfK/SrfK
MSRIVKVLVTGSALLLAAACGQARSAPLPAAAPTVTSPTTTTTTPKPAPPSTFQVQQALGALGYQARQANGALDDETKHAVIDDASAAALRAPRTITPQHATPGTHLEVDIALQVAYVVTDGHVTKIYDACTGDNVGERVTPLGDFHVYYQINFMEYAPLGNLYHPSYITTTGIAVHGGEPVEAVPASNGCVRLTDPSIDDVFPLLHPGAEVLIF